MAPEEHSNKGRKWLFIIVLLILVGLLLWWLFSSVLTKKNSDQANQNNNQSSVSLQGTKLKIDGIEPGEIDLAPLVNDLIKKSPVVTNVTNNYPTETIVQGGSGGTTVTAIPQTLSLSGNVLSISEGNSVTLPSSGGGTDGDGVIGNEMTDVTTGAGLLRVGSGTVVDPYKVGLQGCANTEILKSDGTNWNCAADAGTNYTAGTGISIVAGTISNTGVLTVGGSGPVTSTGGQNPTLTFANGSVSGQVWQWDGDSWELASLPVDGDSVIGNEITNVTGAASGLTRSGAGTSGNPYTIAANTGNGVQISSNAITINSPTCAGTTKLQWNGTAFVCATDVDTTYSAGTGISLVGTTFSNTGVLTVGGSGPVTSTGGQNPSITFANGTLAGQVWQWDGDSWELASLPVDGDSVVGNEVTNVTGVASGLTRSGAGTNGDPYTLAVNTGNGIQIASNALAINSPTCASTTKLQWNGTAFVCSADVDTTYSAGTGLSLVGTTFSNTGVLTVGASGPVTSTGGQNPSITFANGSSAGQVWQWDGDSWELATISGGACTVGGTYICDGGNTLASSVDIGSKDNNALNFLINNSTAATLSTGGSLSLVNGALTLGGTNTVTFTTPQSVGIASKINIPVYDPGNFGQVVAMGVPSSAQSTARVLSLFDNRSSAHQPTLAVFNPAESNSIGLSWEGSNTIGYLKNTSGGIAVRNGTTDNVYFGSNGDVGIGSGTNSPNARLQVSAASGNILAVTDTTATAATVMTVQDEGLAVFQNRTDMASAFRVASSNGTVIFSVDTTNNAVKIGRGDVGVDSNPSRFVLDYSDASSDPAGINGAMYYNQTFNSLRCYEGGTWKSCIAPVDADITMNATNGTTWAAMPAALTELFGTTTQRTSLDTTGGAVQARLMANISTAGSAGSQLRVQYSVNDGGAWNYLDGATGPSVAIDSTGLRISSWVNLESGAKVNENTWFRVVGVTGDGVTSPVVGNVKLQLR